MFTLALFVYFLIGGAVLVWHPLFIRIVLQIHPRRHRIIVVALQRLIFVRAGLF